jgi:hypothetical protein
MLSENGPGPLPPGIDDIKVQYRVEVMTRKEFESIIGSKYDIKLRVLEDEVHFQGQNNPFRMYGYFCSLKL